MAECVANHQLTDSKRLWMLLQGFAIHGAPDGRHYSRQALLGGQLQNGLHSLKP